MIRIKNLSKEFNSSTKLYFNDYVFKTGRSYVIVGPSGCGKSTLLNLLAGIVSPTTGEIRYSTEAKSPNLITRIKKSTANDGAVEMHARVDASPYNECNLAHLSQGDRDTFRFNNIGYIFQDHKLIEDFTVLDNMEVLNINGHQYETADFMKMLEQVQLAEKAKQKVKTLSGGEKQRVAIARALVKKECCVILADEPTGSLNTDLSYEIVELLTTLCKEKKKTVIMVTHDMSLTKYFDFVLDVNDILTHHGKNTSAKQTEGVVKESPTFHHQLGANEAQMESVDTLDTVVDTIDNSIVDEILAEDLPETNIEENIAEDVVATVESIEENIEERVNSISDKNINEDVHECIEENIEDMKDAENAENTENGKGTSAVLDAILSCMPKSDTRNGLAETSDNRTVEEGNVSAHNTGTSSPSSSTPKNKGEKTVWDEWDNWDSKKEDK